MNRHKGFTHLWLVFSIIGAFVVVGWNADNGAYEEPPDRNDPPPVYLNWRLDIAVIHLLLAFASISGLGHGVYFGCRWVAESFLLLLLLLGVLMVIACANPERADRRTFTNPSEPIVEVSLIDADTIAGLDRQGLDLAFGIPFRTSTYVDNGIIVSEDRFYNLPKGNIFQVHLINDLQRGYRVLRIKITFAEPFETHREAIEEAGFDFDTLQLIEMADRFVRYTGKTQHHDWLSINVYLNELDLWAVCIMEVKGA